jgi:L-ribulokinase
VLSLGAAIFAFLAAGTFKTIEEAQEKICPPLKVYEPEKSEQSVYDGLYPLYRKIYFEFGQPLKSALGGILPTLIQTAETVNAAETNRKTVSG